MKMPVVSCMHLKFTHMTMSPQLIGYSLATFHILNAINCGTEQKAKCNSSWVRHI